MDVSAAARHIAQHGISPTRVVCIKPYDASEREEIYLEAHRMFYEYHRKSGVRGMSINETDGMDYWVHIATMNRLRKDMNKDVQSS